jgi:hypothetical protein
MPTTITVYSLLVRNSDMKKKINAESYSFNTVAPNHNLDEPYLPTGVDLEPEVHPKSEILLNAAQFKLNAAHRLVATLKTRRSASIMPSNQAGDHDTHISSVEDLEIEDEEE